MYTTYKTQALVHVAFELTEYYILKMKWSKPNHRQPNNRSLFRELFAKTKVLKIFRNLKNHICK